MIEKKKGVPLRDSSGRGVRANMQRGGCAEPRKTGQGRSTPPPRRGRGWGRGWGRGRGRGRN